MPKYPFRMLKGQEEHLQHATCNSRSQSEIEKVDLNYYGVCFACV